MKKFSVLAVSILALAAQGCASRRPPLPTTEIPPAAMHRKLAEERERLAGPDSPQHLRDTVAGVDITGEGPFTAALHVIVAAPKHLLQNGKTPLIDAAEMEDAKRPGHQREGILKLANYRSARTNPVYRQRFDQIATETQADPSVRAAAIRAMNHCRDHQHTQVFIDALGDADSGVRLEAAKALANLPDSNAAPKLIDRLQKDENKDVRIAAADALREYHTAEVARALVSVLPERDFGVAFRARESLILMTGRNFRFDEAAWLAYFAKSPHPFI